MRTIFALLFLLAGVTMARADAATTGLVKATDVDLSYSLYGAPSTATPVFAVNGGPGLSHVYMLQNDVWPRIAEGGRQVVFYDQRGTGKSTRVRTGASQSMDAQVADLEAIRSKLGFAKIVLVGDSYGGLISMAYAAAHPQHVAKLVLSDSAAPAWKDIVHIFPQVFPDRLEANAAAEKKLGDTEAGAQQSLRDHFMMIFYSEEMRDKYLAGAKDLGYNAKVGEAVGKATEKLDLTTALPKFAFPTMVITGRYDMNVAPLTAWRMHKAIPGSTFVVFEKSGHLPSYEEPDKYVRVMEAFLAK